MKNKKNSLCWKKHEILFLIFEFSLFVFIILCTLLLNKLFPEIKDIISYCSGVISTAITFTFISLIISKLEIRDSKKYNKKFIDRYIYSVSDLYKVSDQEFDQFINDMKNMHINDDDDLEDIDVVDLNEE